MFSILLSIEIFKLSCIIKENISLEVEFMLKEKRIMQINDILQESGHVEIGNLCRMFNVTEMTIRRDLDNLTKGNKGIIRIRGGAMLAGGDALVELPFERRIVSNIELKEKIALKAVEYITNGQTVFIDSGTTTQIMASKISNLLRFVSLTNAINLASELINKPHISVMLIGGELRRNTLSCRGTMAEEAIDKFRVDIAFLALNAIDEHGNLFIANATETGFKKKVMEIAKRKYILVDSSKFGQTSFCKFGTVSDVDGIITDSGITKGQYENCIGLGAKIIIAD